MEAGVEVAPPLQRGLWESVANLVVAEHSEFLPPLPHQKQLRRGPQHKSPQHQNPPHRNLQRLPRGSTLAPPSRRPSPRPPSL